MALGYAIKILTGLPKWPRPDSNRDWHGPKPCASTNWATGPTIGVEQPVSGCKLTIEMSLRDNRVLDEPEFLAIIRSHFGVGVAVRPDSPEV